MKNKQINTARGAALKTLDQVLQKGAYSNLQLNQVLKNSQLSAVDKRLATNLVYGVLQHKLTLEYWLAPFIKGKKTESWVKTLLLMSIYQYQYLDRIPDWAVTNVSIELAKTLGNPGTRRFVTGVLHAILRQGLRSASDIQDPIERRSVEFSLPKWLVEELTKQYGQRTADEIFAAINEPARVSLRVNLAKTTISQAINVLKEQGVEIEKSQVARDGLVVKSGDVINTQAFLDGLVTIQDESALLAVESMQVESSDQVLDACAAPGGKTVQIAAALDVKSGGSVTALDIHPHKIKLIEKNAQRLGVADRVHACQLDARKADEKFADESFDKILVDAPCSGIGLLRRKPEIRYDKKLSDSLQLHEIQLAILNAVAPKVKKGGIITYSTCTILQQENDGTVQAFLAAHPDFKLLKIQTARALKNARTGATLTILPSDYGSDGFFISSLQRL
ncbi:MAG: 16S rRNA (cytosine(967)-C(5))-methyltransferase RsmB [Lactobacillus sp.]|nr:16S rRNA (cytosine(967)-C(5))-methyltransferase RsmB [Lactobacillus sp.]